MTTYGEAFQMGLGANVAVAIRNEVSCAGDALSTFALANIPNASDELKSTITHVLNHLSVIRELAEEYDGYLDAGIEKFDDDNPGKLRIVSKEISESELIVKMQDIIGMPAEERAARIRKNLGELEAREN